MCSVCVCVCVSRHRRSPTSVCAGVGTHVCVTTEAGRQRVMHSARTHVCACMLYRLHACPASMHACVNQCSCDKLILGANRHSRGGCNGESNTHQCPNGVCGKPTQQESQHTWPCQWESSACIGAYGTTQRIAVAPLPCLFSKRDRAPCRGASSQHVNREPGASLHGRAQPTPLVRRQQGQQ